MSKVKARKAKAAKPKAKPARKNKPVAVKKAKAAKTVKAAPKSARATRSEKVRHDGLQRKPVAPPPPRPLTAELLRVRSKLQQMLIELRRDINKEVRGASDRDLAHINDTSDMASDAADGDLSLRIAESETVEAGEIERAIEKVDNGTYGVCETCNRTIGVDRLQFLPFATMCIKCQELVELRKRERDEELDDLSEGAEDPDNA